MRLSALAISALSITLILLFASYAFGEDSRNYFAIKAGFYAPTDDLDDLNLDPGFNGEVAYGRYIHPNFALELGLGYFGSEGDLTVIPVTLNGKGLLKNKNMEVFGGAGIGVYFADLEGVVSTPALGNVSIDDDDAVFGVNFGLGANYNITKKVFIGIEGKYILTADAEFEGVASGGPAKIDSNLNGFLVTGNLGFRF